jgi:hypothetical protein
MDEFLLLMDEVGESQANMTLRIPCTADAEPSACTPSVAEPAWPLSERPIVSDHSSNGPFEVDASDGDDDAGGNVDADDPDSQLARAVAHARRTEEKMLSWLRDSTSVRAWASALDLETLLAETDGIVCTLHAVLSRCIMQLAPLSSCAAIPNFFPDFVAEGALQAVCYCTDARASRGICWTPRLLCRYAGCTRANGNCLKRRHGALPARCGV